MVKFCNDKIKAHWTIINQKLFGGYLELKRSTALKNVAEIARRLNVINGNLSTPKHNHNYIRIKRAWVFGSVAKGSDAPNDIDIFIELYRVGKRYGAHEKYSDRFLDKDYCRRYGIQVVKSAEIYAIQWLRKGMKNVSVHTVENDKVFEDLDLKILIYPRNDFIGV